MEREDERITEVLLPSHDGAALMDELIQKVDAVGGFQKLFNGLFNFCAVVVGVMSVYTLVLAMKVPDHWCYVPGRASTNFNPSEWKNLTLPRCYILITERGVLVVMFLTSIREVLSSNLARDSDYSQ
jgi:hypothetical protein